ncbi:hypothetical protein DFH08DRAFT_828115 [Mycena albidolilacea]|uniref:Uncharacterized protein n=1 Tax=Mycena albidolilacea TaxID=1033008 RepID=A0AAD7E6P9_9AGAR|nr:hypothetical protein DFH08DRAFT_828115 [Mycena albidolilacea]
MASALGSTDGGSELSELISPFPGRIMSVTQLCAYKRERSQYKKEDYGRRGLQLGIGRKGTSQTTVVAFEKQGDIRFEPSQGKGDCIVEEPKSGVCDKGAMSVQGQWELAQETWGGDRTRVRRRVKRERCEAGECRGTGQAGGKIRAAAYHAGDVSGRMMRQGLHGMWWPRPRRQRRWRGSSKATTAAVAHVGDGTQCVSVRGRQRPPGGLLMVQEKARTGLWAMQKGSGGCRARLRMCVVRVVWIGIELRAAMTAGECEEATETTWATRGVMVAPHRSCGCRRRRAGWHGQHDIGEIDSGVVVYDGDAGA